MNSHNPDPNSAELKYKGVRKRIWGTWVSEIRLPHSRRRIWLGAYDTPEKAARAFDAAQFCLRGPSAIFNFPDNLPEIDGGQGLSPAEIQLAAARFADAAEEPQPRSPPAPDADAPVEVEEDAPSYSGRGHMERLGSGYNYEEEFGLVQPLGDFFGPQQPDTVDYGYGNSINTGSGTESSSLWNWNF